MRALVTGGAGFAGRHLLDALSSAGHEVHAAGLAHGNRPPVPARWHALDVTDAAACAEVLGACRPEWVFHLAGFAHVGQAERDPEACLAVNFGGTRALLEACLAQAPRARVLVVSSAAVYGHVPPEALPVREEQPLAPGSIYAVSKAAAEMAAQHAHARGLDLVVLRPFNHTGPGQTDDYVAPAFAHQLARIEAGRQAPVLAVGNLEAVRDLIDVRDTVAAYVRSAEAGRSGATYNVTGGRGVAVRELLATLCELSGLEVSVEQNPERLRPLDMPVFHGSGERLQADTGFTARIELRRTLADVLDYWRAREGIAVERR